MSQVTPPRGLTPHRGTAILVLGILSLVIGCVGWILGIIAWTMASNDLRQMDAGQMDPTGRGNTQAGKICGMVAVILHLFSMFAFLAWLVLVVGILGATASGHR